MEFFTIKSKNNGCRFVMWPRRITQIKEDEVDGQFVQETDHCD